MRFRSAVKRLNLWKVVNEPCRRRPLEQTTWCLRERAFRRARRSLCRDRFSVEEHPDPVMAAPTEQCESCRASAERISPGKSVWALSQRGRSVERELKIKVDELNRPGEEYEKAAQWAGLVHAPVEARILGSEETRQ